MSVLGRPFSRSKHYKTGLLALAIVGGLFAAWLLGVAYANITNSSAETEDGRLDGAYEIVENGTASQGRAIQFGSSAATPSAPATPTAPTTPTAGRSIKGQPLYVYNHSEWAGRPGAIYDYQVGRWYGNWTPNPAGVVGDLVGQAKTAGELPLLVAYNIPGRDCGSYSSGGAGNSAGYRTWIQSFAQGIGNRPAIVVLEPDALAQVDCLNAADQNARIADIAYAVDLLKTQTGASVYIDGGNVGWKSAAEMAGLLKRAGVANATGFSLNVSNFKLSAESAAYGDQIVGLLQQQGVAGARYVIDTSRNGRGPANTGELSWCNPQGRGLGARPTTAPAAGTHNDAYLWIKTIGESDGECGRGEPAAGQWFPSYAQMLITNAVH